MDVILLQVTNYKESDGLSRRSFAHALRKGGYGLLRLFLGIWLNGMTGLTQLALVNTS